MTLTALVLSSALSLGTAEVAQFVHDFWGTKEGLPQSSVTSILQTSDGYLWLGTQGGLVRFDGIRFQVFAPATNPGLTSSRIRTLFEDRQHTLWIGTEEGGLVRYADGVFSPINRTPFSTATVARVLAAGNDGLWVGTTAGLFELQGNAVHARTRSDGSPLIAMSIALGRSPGELWIGTSTGLVHSRPERLDTFTTADGLPGNIVVSLLRARDGSLWIGTDRGLAHSVNDAIPANVVPGLAGHSAAAMVEDARGDIWVASDGLYRVTPGGVSSIPALGRQSLITVATDREGNLWAGTVVNGLARLKAARVSMVPLIEGASYGVVPITEDAEGTMWIGGVCVGLLRYRHGERRLLAGRDGVPGCVWSLLSDTDGALWIGTYGAGLTRYTSSQSRTFTRANSGLQDDTVGALFKDHEGVLWIGTQGGLQKYTGQAFTTYRTSDGLVNDDVRFITEDRHGAMWIGTIGGVSRFAGGRFTNYTTANGLTNNSVRAIYEDADGVIWIGTYGGGLMRFKDGRFARITRADGLFDDIVSRIIEDDRGFLWMIGNRGIFRASRESLNAFADGRARAVASISYGVTDGMKTQETYGGAQPAGWKARDGRLWFPTIDGVAVIDSRIPDNALPPPIAIERVAVDDRELDRSAPIVLPSGRMRLEIAYTALTLTAPEKAQFRYRLEGYETQPVEAGTRRVAYYTNLPPGNYVFRATGSNHDGVWNDVGATLGITITAPFWMTWWFRSSAALALAALAFAGHRMRIAALNRRQALHEAFTRQLIESQEAERTRIARELHDSLGQSLVMIKNQAQLGLTRADGGGASMTEISTMAGHAIAEVKQIAYDLRPYQLDRLGLTKALEALAARVETSTALGVQARIANVDDVLSKEAEITLYRIVQESINNIVKHAQATTLEVEIACDDRAVRARIADNGRGFDVDAARRAQGGMGLAGIGERAAMLRATLHVTSAPGRGTTIELTIPRGEHA